VYAVNTWAGKTSNSPDLNPCSLPSPLCNPFFLLLIPLLPPTSCLAVISLLSSLWLLPRDRPITLPRCIGCGAQHVWLCCGGGVCSSSCRSRRERSRGECCFFNLNRVAAHMYIYNPIWHVPYMPYIYIYNPYGMCHTCGVYLPIVCGQLYCWLQPLLMNSLIKFKTRFALSWVGALFSIQNRLALP
jgi:hypothetical protein